MSIVAAPASPWNHKNWKWFIPGHIWLAPFTVIYAIFCFLKYGARSWGLRNGVVIAIADKPIVGNPGAQTIGALTCFANTTEEARVDLHVHENTHIVEGFLFATGGFIVWPWIWLALGGAFTTGLLLGGFVGAAAYSLTYGVVFGYFYLTKQKDEEPGWHDDYHRNFLEKSAYANQALYLSNPQHYGSVMWV